MFLVIYISHRSNLYKYKALIEDNEEVLLTRSIFNEICIIFLKFYKEMNQHYNGSYFLGFTIHPRIEPKTFAC